MLSFRVSFADLNRPLWSWIDDRWINGESWIKPVVHPMLEWHLAHDGTAEACAIVRERHSRLNDAGAAARRPVRAAAADAVSANRLCAGEYTKIEMRPGRLRVTASQFGTAPLYITTNTGLVVGSWNLPDIRPYLDRGKLLDRAVTRALTRQHRYSSDTVFDNVHRLTERASATVTTSGISIEYPPPAEHVLQPRASRPGVDLVAAFHELLTHTVTQIPALPGDLGIELSGGADSANVALSVAARRDDQIRSYGLIVQGDCGLAQRRRRAAMVKKFGFHDHEVSAEDHPPFGLRGVRTLGAPHDPVAAHYREAFDALRDSAGMNKTRVMLTGIGGDELNAPHPEERTDLVRVSNHVPWLGATARAALPNVNDNLAPVSPVSVSALMAFALHNPAYLQAGIWPLAPLAHPTIVRFAEQLPLDLRQGKALFRQRLRRAGFSSEVADPPQPETFVELMQTGLRTFGLPLLRDMLRESILVDMGYLDHRALARAYEEALGADRVPSLLCDAIKVEIGLRSLQ